MYSFGFNTRHRKLEDYVLSHFNNSLTDSKPTLNAGIEKRTYTALPSTNVFRNSCSKAPNSGHFLFTDCPTKIVLANTLLNCALNRKHQFTKSEYSKWRHFCISFAWIFDQKTPENPKKLVKKRVEIQYCWKIHSLK